VNWTLPMLAAPFVLALGAPPAWLLGGRGARLGAQAGQLLALVGAALGLGCGIPVLLGNGTLEYNHPWPMPFGAIHLRLDPLAALFLVLVLALAAVLIVFTARTIAPAAQAWFNILLASLVVVILARNITLFLVAWEVMAVSSFLLIASGRLADTPEGQEGAWSYLIATHLGTACLLAMLPVLASPGTGTLRIDQALDFDDLRPGRLTPLQLNVLFLLALAGFGTKAALAPFHAWVARAYRVTPAWVAAASSALMAKVSLYVLFRTVLELTAGHAPPAWWGLTLIGLGVLSGFLGMGGAIGATRIKVVLGYSSVENVGIISLGFGLGLLGISDGAPAIAVLGFGGALYHIINHAILKTLMFTATGLVEQNAGTDDLARLGGLLGRMPVVGTCVGIGSLALSGLPTLNAFASEWLIYRGLFRSVGRLSPANHVMAMATVAALALIGGLAAVCFTGLFGIGFLGVARSNEAGEAGEPISQRTERALLAGLAVAVLFLGVFPSFGVLVIRSHVQAMLAGLKAGGAADALASSFAPLSGLTVVSLLLIGTVVVLKLLRDRRLSAQPVTRGPTWDCGYGYRAAFPRGQYTPVSFMDPLAPMFPWLTVRRERKEAIAGYFPASGAVEVESDDLIAERVLRPVFHFAGLGIMALRWIQRGSIQLYLLFLFTTLVVMLIWQILF
jgi:formate hydrogenlyase subunit 3/multisubunit Na+/H+ antiporter MnhD subunit